MYSAEEVERIKREYDAKLAALENKIDLIEKSVIPKSPEGSSLRTPMPHSSLLSLERSTPQQLLELFESTLVEGSKKPDVRILSSAWGILFSGLFLSGTDVQNEIDTISRENREMLKKVIRADCTRGGRFVFTIIRKGGKIDRAALIMIADFRYLAGIEQDGITAIHMLAKVCDKNIRPVFIERAGKKLLSELYDSDGIPPLFTILGLGNLSVYDLEAIEKVFSHEDLKQVMAKNRTGRNAFEAFTEISDRLRENLAHQRKTFMNARPGAMAADDGNAGPRDQDNEDTGMPVSAGAGNPAEPGTERMPPLPRAGTSPGLDPEDTSDKSIKILIVDDSEILRCLLLQRLNNLGYENCIQAKSGDEAVTLAESARPYLVFMDINMPGKLDGIAAAREIKAHADTRIIFLTSCCNKETLERAKGVDPDGYILKPFSEKNIRVALRLLG